jgi:RNA polymerase sigma-70 factor (ECF subfamily)
MRITKDVSWGVVMLAAIGISGRRSHVAKAISLPAPQVSAGDPAAKPSQDLRSDEWLLVRIARRDEAAMHALYSRYSVRLYRFVVRLIRDPSLAEDLVSEVFLDVWRNARTFRAQSQVSTWLYAIARHKALTALRRRTDETLDDEVAVQIEDHACTPEDALAGKTRSELIQVCLSRLSPLHREVIDLVYYHERPIHEVAQIVGVCPNTVKTRLHYARAHIERLLMQSAVTSLH